MGKSRPAKQKIAFIINPVSGKGKTRSKNALQTFVKNYSGIELLHPPTAEATLESTRQLAKENFNAVFACGGDGTLNLISSALVGTETALAMVPLGSGNGYARHQHIPMKWQEAVKIIDLHEESYRDTGTINGIHFLNIAGVGYAAKISNAFKHASGRGLSGYLLTISKNLKRKPFDIAITEGLGIWEGKAWMVEFCNGSQWGNNISIAPGAQDDDGTLNTVIFQPFSALKTPVVGFRIAGSKPDKVPEIRQLQGDHFVMNFEGTQYLHVDGEGIGKVEKSVEVKVVPKSLKVWRFPS